MYLDFILATFFAAISFTLAAPQGPWPLGYNEYECVSQGCRWDFTTRHCICSYCPAPTGNEPYLASFYTGKDFVGSELKVYGNYGRCLDLPDTWATNGALQVASMKSNSVPGADDVCCVFTQWGCNTLADYTPVAANVADFLGVYKNGVQSLLCSRWVNDYSTCFHS